MRAWPRRRRKIQRVRLRSEEFMMRKFFVVGTNMAFRKWEMGKCITMVAFCRR